jgi:single-stranded DNA-binding protein
MNKVLIKGRIVNDPVIKSAGAPCEFKVMTRDDWKGDHVEGKNNNEFHKCVVWSTKGEWASKNLVKGDTVFIEGFLKHSKITIKIKDENGDAVVINGKPLTVPSIRSEIKVKNIDKI